jgi:hypothetical protein
MQRHVEADRLGRLKIDDKLELGWRLHWKLGWLVALENAIDIRRRTPKIIGPVNAVGQQAANFSEKTLLPFHAEFCIFPAACNGTKCSRPGRVKVSRCWVWDYFFGREPAAKVARRPSPEKHENLEFAECADLETNQRILGPLLIR